MGEEEKIVIVAGPNGAGKTTFAHEFLPNEAGLMHFVNADLIAAGLSPFAPEKAAIRAGRIMMEMIQDFVQRNESFAFESTLSGRGYSRLIPEWQSAGYRVKLIFLSLPSEKMAVERVAMRVKQGGHSVPEAVIRRRFRSGIINFETVYKAIVDIWALYDNSTEIPMLIGTGGKNV